MSTRAVYQFFNRAENKKVLFYKHHDGYPDGLGGALTRIQSVLALAQHVDLKVVRDVMLSIVAEELRDEMEADQADQQHRYNVRPDDGHVTLTHYDRHGGKSKSHYVLTADGWMEEWMEKV